MFNKFTFRKIFRPFNIFYFLMAYVMTFFVWWMIFHFENLNEIKRLYLKNADLVDKYEKLDEFEKQESSFALGRSTERYNKSVAMILGEGGVFFLILLLAGYWIHAGFKREIMLTQQQRNFMLSITHELKSPLASIKLSNETLLSRQLPLERQKKLLSNALKDVDRLNTLVENILLAARIENQSFQLSEEELDFSELVKDTVFKLTEAAPTTRKINIDITPNVIVMGDRHALISIINNLTENALKYTPATAAIHISLQATSNLAQLIVADEGDGIPETEKNRIFQKFYRVGSEDTRKAKGTGLGLFLVKELVELHKGTIKLSNNIPQGSLFIVDIPCFKAINSDDGIDQLLEDALSRPDEDMG